MKRRIRAQVYFKSGKNIYRSDHNDWINFSNYALGYSKMFTLMVDGEFLLDFDQLEKRHLGELDEIYSPLQHENYREEKEGKQAWFYHVIPLHYSETQMYRNLAVGDVIVIPELYRAYTVDFSGFSQVVGNYFARKGIES